MKWHLKSPEKNIIENYILLTLSPLPPEGGINPDRFLAPL
jgi:hypothetical protein